MKLVTLSVACLAGSVLGMAALVVVTVQSLDQIRAKQQEVSGLLDLRNDIDEFSTASTTILLFDADESLWNAYRDDALRIQERLTGLGNDHPEARKASRHMGLIMDVLVQIRSRPAPPDHASAGYSGPSVGPLGIHSRSRLIMNQFAGHLAALGSALDLAVRERQQIIAEDANRMAGVFAGAALLFAVLCMAAFALIHRRINRPIHQLVNAMGRIREGDLVARAEVKGADELAALATEFNRLIDERQRVEERLTERQAELQRREAMLVDSQRMARTGSWRLYLADYTMEWTAEVYRILGLPTDSVEPTHDAFFDLIHPDDRHELLQIEKAAIKEASPYDHHFRVVRPDGEIRYVHEHAEVQHDVLRGGRVLSGTIQDVTDLRRLDERLRAILESVTDAFFTLDEEWRFGYVNMAAETLLERARDELVGKNVWAEFPDAVGTPIEKEYRRAVAERVTVALEEYYPPLGKWFDIRAYPTGEGLAVYFRDNTAQRRMLEQLRAQEETVRASRDELARVLETRQALINSLPAHIALIDAHGNILDVNEQWRHFGLENDYADPALGIGVNYISVCDNARGECAEGAKETADGIRELLSGDRDVFTREYPCHSPDTQRWFRVMANRLVLQDEGERTYGAVVMHVDITERKLAERELNRLAYQDHLTSLPSRNGFVQGLSERLGGGGWDPDAIVVSLNVRGLHDINDAHGFAAGDTLLTAIAQRLGDHAGHASVVGRAGGDDFLVFLPCDADDSEAGRLDKLMAAFDAPFDLDGTTVEVAARFGYTRLGTVRRDVEDLIREASLALSHTRHTYSGYTWTAYSEKLDLQAKERVRINRELHRALDREEFELHFQPKVALADGALVACEALLRWRHPERGLQSPQSFIPNAEQSQLIGPIGEWVVHEACRNLRAWQDAGLDIVRVAVNVSLVQFMVGDLTRTVGDALAAHGIAASNLSLEITESIFGHQSDVLLEQMNELHRLGVQLSLDDFGTGYSSLLYLQRYPFDEIKIDRGFVSNVLDDSYSRHIVTTVVGVAGAIGADAIAEGVESAEVRDALLELGCRLGQGYYYSMPLEAEDFRWLLEKRSTLPLSGALS